MEVVEGMKINAYDAAELLREALEKRIGAEIDEITIESFGNTVAEFTYSDAHVGEIGRVEFQLCTLRRHRLRAEHARLDKK